MKKLSKKTIIIIGVALLLIITGLVLILTGNNKSIGGKGKKTPDNVDDPTKPVIKVFTKADVMSLIYQFKAMDTSDGDWYVGDTALLAHNSDNTKYLARYKKVLSDGTTKEYETIVSYGDDGYTIDLPGWDIDSKPLEEFAFIYYKEGEEGYDPINQQYNQIEPGWNSSDWEYVPDESWKEEANKWQNQ